MVHYKLQRVHPWEKDNSNPQSLGSCGYPGVLVTDMVQAQLEALKALQAKQVALLTPYIEELSQANAEMLESMGGFCVVSRLTMNLPTDDLTPAVPPAEIADWAVRADSPQADVVVIGCSGFRACQPDFLDALEQRLGKPVVTSTQAFLWHMARSAGVQKKIKGYGTLLSSHCASWNHMWKYVEQKNTLESH